MPAEPRPITLFEVAKRAVDVCDPADEDPSLGSLLAQFEDSDEPVAGLENLEEKVAIAVEGVDVEDEDPAVEMATATILYLARRRDEMSADDQHILRLAARAEWKGDPPDRVVDWLSERGVSL